MKREWGWGRGLGMAACLLQGIGAAGLWAAEEAQLSPDEEMRQAEAARRKDPAWKPAFAQLATIKVGKTTKGGSVHNYCIDREGNLLVGSGGTFTRPMAEGGAAPQSVTEPPEIRVYSPAGKLLKQWPLEKKPQAICLAPDGTIFAAGGGQIVRLSAEGKVLCSATSPVANEPVVIGKDIEEMLKEQNRLNAETLKAMKESLETRRGDITGMGVTARDVFVACPAPNDFTYRVYRFDLELKNPKLVVEKLRGCCGQMDIQARGDNLWIAHNARHRVECRDREGKEVSQFGKRGRVKAEHFGGCCEPKNLRVLDNGDLLAAESGPPTCIKRFNAQGKFLGLLALPDMKGDCVRVTVEVSPDGKRFYLLDTYTDVIRVFGAKS